MRSSPEIFCSREPPLLTQAGAVPRRRNGLAYFGPTGVQEQGAGTRGSLGNLRDPAVSVVTAGLESRLTNSRLIHSSVPSWWGRTGDERWYRQAKETKCGEMSGRESERSIVTLRRGNLTEGPRGGRRSEANCLTSGCKSRRRRSPCGAVVISGSLRGDSWAGSPDVQAPGGQVGLEPPWSGQHRGQAIRRAVAKANGLSRCAKITSAGFGRMAIEESSCHREQGEEHQRARRKGEHHDGTALLRVRGLPRASVRHHGTAPSRHQPTGRLG